MNLHTRMPDKWDRLDRSQRVFERAHACGFSYDADLMQFCRPDEPGVWRPMAELDAEYTAWVALYGEPCILKDSGEVCPDAEWWEE